MDINKLTRLNDEQKRQVLRQWRAQQHKSHSLDIAISPCGDLLKDFYVRKGVWNPVNTSSRYNASYLFYNQDLYRGKKVLDLGCGTGLMGIVMGKYGATNVDFIDYSPLAIDNTQENISRFKLRNNTSCILSDLFNMLGEEKKYDLIVFTQPFFGDKPPSGDDISSCMLDSGDLIFYFFSNCRLHLTKNGQVLMPSYSIAGDTNNPAIKGPRFGFKVNTAFTLISRFGLQKGTHSIHKLKPITNDAK